MKFQQIRSALSVVEFAGVRFLIDPMLAPKNTYPTFPYTCVTGEGNPTTELPVSLESLFDVDAVIVTHLHLDPLTTRLGKSSRRLSFSSPGRNARRACFAATVLKTSACFSKKVWNSRVFVSTRRNANTARAIW